MDADAARRAGLRRMKALATALLVVSVAVFLLTRNRSGALGFVNAAAEAATVGAAADWFAVTALFRRPLGLPIPHTAIIPTRKDALGRSLQEFVATNFLAESVVRERIGSAQVARRSGVWLSDPAHAARVAGELAAALRGTLVVLRDDEVAALLERVVLRPVLSRPWGPPAGRLLQRLVEDGAHQRLLDLAAGELRAWLGEHQHLITALVAQRAPAWTPAWLDERIARKAYQEALRWADEIQTDPSHPVRLAAADAMIRLAKNLQTDPGTMLQAEAAKERLLIHPGVRAALEAMWTSTRSVLVEASHDPGSDLRLRATSGLQALGARLAADKDLQASVDRYLEDAAGHLIVTFRDEAATVISETVSRWDAADASRRIELHVGGDLQFIRINGTIVGALVGLIIHTTTVLLG